MKASQWILRGEDGTAELEVPAGLAGGVHTYGKVRVGMRVHAEMNEQPGETLFAKGERDAETGMLHVVFAYKDNWYLILSGQHFFLVQLALDYTAVTAEVHMTK